MVLRPLYLTPYNIQCCTLYILLLAIYSVAPCISYSLQYTVLHPVYPTLWNIQCCTLYILLLAIHSVAPCISYSLQYTVTCGLCVPMLCKIWRNKIQSQGDFLQPVTTLHTHSSVAKQGQGENN